MYIYVTLNDTFFNFKILKIEIICYILINYLKYFLTKYYSFFTIYIITDNKSKLYDICRIVYII